MALLPERPALRFAIVGVVNFAVSCLVFLLAWQLLPVLFATVTPLGPKGIATPAPIGAAANGLSYLAGMINSFALNRAWTFRAHGRAGKQAARFTIVNLGCLAVGSAAMYALVDVRGLPELAVWLPLTACLIMLNFAGCKYWVFITA